MTTASTIDATTPSSGASPAVEALPSTYTVEALPNGKFRVPNVPIFAEHERDLGDGRKFKATLAWLTQATFNMRRRAEVDKYLPAVHLGHHDARSTQERPAVGVFESPRLQRALYEGKPSWVIFSDFLVDSAKDLEKLKKYRYRSVEIKNLNGEPKIDGVALLQSRSPYFKFPNLEFDAASAALGYEADGTDGAAFHWPTPLHFAEDCMAGETPPMPQAQGGDAAPPWAQQMMGLLQKLCSIFDAPVEAQAPPATPVMQAAEPAKNPLPITTPAPVAAVTAPAPAPLPIQTATAAKNGTAVSYVEPVVAFAQKAAAAAQISTKVRDEAITWAESELADRPTGDAKDLRGLLEVQYSQGGRPAVETAVAVMKTMLPSLPGPNAHADARMPAPKDELEARYADDPVALEVIADMKALRGHLPAKYRNDSLESFIESDPRMEGRVRPAGAKG